MAWFIFNEGTYAHRGVWHLVEDLRTEEIAEVQKPNVSKIYDWNHPLHNDYVSSSMDFATKYPVLGEYTTVIVRPAHKVYHATVACGSFSHQRWDGKPAVKDELKTGGLRWNARHPRKPVSGKTYTLTEEVMEPMLVEGIKFPPGPQCSRCRKILDRG